jgi:hypothetical protein
MMMSTVVSSSLVEDHVRGMVALISADDDVVVVVRKEGRCSKVGS